MYKVFVVEDEPLIRQSLRTAIESADGPYTFCGEAADGEMALSMMMDLQPDILVTDIKMPFMDGLELSRIAKETLPWLKIVIISGHDEFGYAQQAITIGVDQYLLKPIRKQELVAAVDTAVRSIEAERKRTSSAESYDERRVQAALFRDLMHHLLFGDVGTARILDDARQIGVNLVHSLHKVIIVQILGSSADESRKVRESFADRLEYDIPFPGLFVVPDQLAFVVSADTPEELAEQTYSTLRIILHDFEAGGLKSVAVVSETAERLSSVAAAYQQADSLVHLAGHLYAGQVIDLGDRSQTPDVLGTSTGSFGANCRKKLLHAGPMDGLKILRSFLDNVDAAALDSSMGRFQILSDIFNTCIDVILESNPDTTRKDVSANLATMIDIVDAANTRETFEDLGRRLIESTLSARQSSIDVAKRGEVIQQAVDFIRGNYANPDISLHTVSAHVGFSPSHFSMVFSQKMGRTFIDYLTGVRIDKAKELLTETDRKLSAIAIDIGYNEPNYFSYVFKKREGVSPKEFRSRVRS